MASIVKRKTGYFVVYRVDGRQIWKKGGERKKDAERLKTEIERQLQVGEYRALPEITFAELAKKWSETHAGKVRPKTMEGYQIHLRRHILPYFGRYKVKAITAESIEQFITSLLSATLAAQTAIHYLRTLKLILKQGVIWGYLSRNPGEYVKPPRRTKKEIAFFSQEELNVLIERTIPEHKPMIATAVLTGMRRGELLALSWGDIDFLNHRIHIRHAISGRKLSEPKSRHSRRVINVPRGLAELLREHQLRQTVELEQNADNLVFPNQNGKLMDHSTLLRHIFWPALRMSGLPKIRFHDLRHSFASMLINRGENIKYIQRVLGHSSVQITLDVYGHLLPEAGAESAERLDQAFFKHPITKSVV